jgi:membrane protease YdiL (CAAX protease family)
VINSQDTVLSEQASLQQSKPSTPLSLQPNISFWGHPLLDLLAAFLTWLASIALLFLPQVLALPYVASHYRGTRPTAEILLADKNLIIILVSGILPAHLITLLIAWCVVTRFGSVSVIKALGLSSQGGMKVWQGVVLAIFLFVVAWTLTVTLGGKETELERLVESSRAAALIIAFLAVATAPIVEETIYRGILYPAVEGVAGSIPAVIVVTLMFAVPHIPQYWPNFAVISSITLLSVVLTVVRARTGRLLPCFVIHFVFNGIQSLLIVFDPYLRALLNSWQHRAASPGVIGLLFGLR